MNLRFILHDLIASLKQWIRSIGTVFWTIMFPILLIIIFGAIFSGSNSTSYDIVVQDLDESVTSQEFIDILSEFKAENITLSVNVVENDVDLERYMLDHDNVTALQIPKGFGDSIQKYFTDKSSSVDILFYFDPSEQTTTASIRFVIANILNGYNKGITQSKDVVGLSDVSILANEDYEYIDYFVPGIIGFTIMTSMIYGSIERNTKFRKAGILRKLLTMPVSRADWIISKMLFMLVLSFISSFVIIGVGILVWGLSIKINLFFFVIVVSTSFMFSGMGMIVSRFVKDEETADMAGGAITFPMMFLAGTFFPLEQMPALLQSIAQVLPLYYVNEGFRNAMIYGDMDKTLFFTGVVLVFAVVFFIAGVLLTKWKED